MNSEKVSYRPTWTYDLNGTSSGERSALCEKSAVVCALASRARGPALPARQPHCHNDRVRGRPAGGPVPLPLSAGPLIAGEDVGRGPHLLGEMLAGFRLSGLAHLLLRLANGGPQALNRLVGLGGGGLQR